MKANHPISGSCLCGSVQLQLEQVNRDVVICHCQQCRKQTGHVVAATRVEDQHLKIEGEENLQWYAASENAQRGFCKTCGSLLLWKNKTIDNTSIMAGCLESPTGLNVSSHIFVADKGDYYDIADGEPQFEQTDS